MDVTFHCLVRDREGGFPLLRLAWASMDREENSCGSGQQGKLWEFLAGIVRTYGVRYLYWLSHTHGQSRPSRITIDSFVIGSLLCRAEESPKKCLL